MKNLWLLFAVGLAASPPAQAAPLDWHFSFTNGKPDKLVWRTEVGFTYDLWQSEDLVAPFTHVGGFPKDGTGSAMEHAFTPGVRGFFQIEMEESEFVLIPAGSFLMGDQTAPDYEGYIQERPQHSVYVSGFLMARHEVTKALWDEVQMWGLDHGYTDLGVGGGKGPDHPVHSISWHEMLKWCNARGEMEGLTPCYRVSGSVYKTGDSDGVTCDWSADGYRLPTEGEWEKAARGGLNGKRFPWGNTITHQQANYNSSGEQDYDISPTTGYHPSHHDGVTPFTSPAGSFASNGYGLYDVAGNVWERCWDWWDEDYYLSSPGTDPRGPAMGGSPVVRGGSYSNNGDTARCAQRNRISTGLAHILIGFRLARSPAP